MKHSLIFLSLALFSSLSFGYDENLDDWKPLKTNIPEADLVDQRLIQKHLNDLANWDISLREDQKTIEAYNTYISRYKNLAEAKLKDQKSKFSENIGDESIPALKTEILDLVINPHADLSEISWSIFHTYPRSPKQALQIIEAIKNTRNSFLAMQDANKFGLLSQYEEADFELNLIDHCSRMELAEGSRKPVTLCNLVRKSSEYWTKQKLIALNEMRSEAVLLNQLYLSVGQINGEFNEIQVLQKQLKDNIDAVDKILKTRAPLEVPKKLKSVAKKLAPPKPVVVSAQRVPTITH